MINLYDQLRSVLTPWSLYWTSATYCNIAAVRLPLWAMWGYRKQPVDSYELLMEQTRLNGGSNDWYKVGSYLMSVDAQVYHRATRFAGAYTLLIAVRQGLFFTGIRTTVLQPKPSHKGSNKKSQPSPVAGEGSPRPESGAPTVERKHP